MLQNILAKMMTKLFSISTKRLLILINFYMEIYRTVKKSFATPATSVNSFAPELTLILEL